MNQPATLSDQLRRAIQDSGQTAYAVGRAAEVDPGIIQRFMTGKRGLSLDSADRIALALCLRLAREPSAKRPLVEPESEVSRLSASPESLPEPIAPGSIEPIGPLAEPDVEPVVLAVPSFAPSSPSPAVNPFLAGLLNRATRSIKA
jgi:hypothetical protein